MATVTRRGAFILFEGIDRCGKTTQSKLLAETLKREGNKVETMRFPDRTTTIGKMIDAYLKMGIDLHDRAIHLLFSANRWELAYVMIGKCVCCNFVERRK